MSYLSTIKKAFNLKSIELKENTREIKGDNLRRCIEYNADYSFEFDFTQKSYLLTNKKKLQSDFKA